MSERSQVGLKDACLEAIGQRVGPLNALSPFMADVVSEGDPTADLAANGIIDASGQLTEPAGSALRRLAQPRFASRFVFTGPPTSLEYVAYFDGGPDAICLMATEDGYSVEWPAGPEEVLGFLIEYAGVSSEPNVPAFLELPYQDARVALAVVDATRQYVLAHVALEREMAKPVVAFNDLLPRLEPDSAHFNRLESVLRQLDLDDPALSPPDLKSCLDRLTAQGLLEEQPSGGWVLAGQLILLLDGFLNLTGQYRVDTLSVDAQNAVAGGRAVVAQAGQRGLLYMEHDEGTIRMSAVSGEQLAEIIATLFAVDDDGMPLIHEEVAQPAVAQPVEPAPGPEGQAAPSFCGKCGSPVDAGVKFCGKCGNPMG
jgi:hypothetical protein